MHPADSPDNMVARSGAAFHFNAGFEIYVGIGSRDSIIRMVVPVQDFIPLIRGTSMEVGKAAEAREPLV